MRKSVSVAFFSLMSTLLIFGTVIMGGSELVLFSNYFAQERYDVLDEVVNVAQRTASHLVQEAALPEGEELEALNTKLELIGESAEVYLFFTDCDGNVVLASDPDDLAGDVVEASVLEKSAKAKENYHIFGTLDGVLTEKSYISVHEMRSESGECTGYLFLCSSGDRLVEFRNEFFSNFFLSACLMLLVASVLTKVMMHKLTDPIQKAQYLERIGEEGRRMSNLIDDILRLSSLESKQAEEIWERVDLRGLCEDIFRSLEPIMKKRGITGEIFGAAHYYAYPDDMRQLLKNLMENAVKYNRENGRVTVRISPDAYQCVISVVDTGIGIPLEHQSRVFERFYRVDKGRSKREGGTGLGLSIVKHITAKYAGQITLVSRPDEGTSIRVTLPVTEEGRR